jgi:hypothetical protein
MIAGVTAGLAHAGNGLHSVPLVMVSTAQPEPIAGVVMREIDDAGSGVRWLLIQDPAHRGGPGRLVAVRFDPDGNGPQRSAAFARPAPVIHAGDAVQVEEHSAVVDASLEAVALGSAIQGGPLKVRLKVGGRIVAAVALGPGRALLAQAAGGRP